MELLIKPKIGDKFKCKMTKEIFILSQIQGRKNKKYWLYRIDAPGTRTVVIDQLGKEFYLIA